MIRRCNLPGPARSIGCAARPGRSASPATGGATLPTLRRPEAEKIRDYYAVEDTEGARFWLFRAGLHDGVVPARWYLHGFFA